MVAERGGGLLQQAAGGEIAGRGVRHHDVTGDLIFPVMFDVAEKSDGHGLASMRERTEALGGRLDLVSQPGGTTLTFTIPLVQGDADATVRGSED